MITRMQANGEFLDDERADEGESSSLKTAAWFGVAVGALALGVFLGREIRSRYKFKRRTPYDYFAHAGDHDAGDDQDGFGEFGFGI